MTMSSAEWDAKAAAVIAEFRANGGVVGGEFEGFPLLLLHTRDVATGLERVNVVMYLLDGDRRVIFASHSGFADNPLWYGNLVADADIDIEVGGGREAVRAVVLEGAERDEIYARQVAGHPVFAEYEARTTRRIPVIALYPR